MKTFIAYLVTIATVVAAAVFTKTIVEAALYVPNSTGIVTTSTITTSTSTDTPTDTLDVPPVASATIATVAKNAAVIPPGYPERLSIPALNISAAVQDVGITVKGTMGVPNNFTDVGWYIYGAMPGQKGNAVIDGHVDNGLGLDGVFKHLSDLHIGDSVYVTNHAGKKFHFKVSDIEYYSYINAPVEQIFGTGTSNSSTQLKLITCDGTWVPDQKTYDERLVVTANLVP